MKTYKIDCDEAYPDWYFTEDGRWEAVFSDEEIKWIKKVWDDYEKLNDFIEERIKKKMGKIWD